MIYAIFLIGLSMLLSTLLHPPVRALALRVGAVDQPQGRKRHRGDIPRWGGVGIAMAVLGTWFVGRLLSDWLGFVWHTILPEPAWFATAAGAMLLLGMVDDLVRLRALPKALVQLGCAWLVWWGGIRVELLTNPFGGEPWVLGAWSAPVTVLWLMTVTNAFNLVDGLDGLAAGLALIALSGFSLIALFRRDTMILYAVAPFLGALLGFLPYNVPKAVSFLGDSGSYLLGFVLGVFALLSNQKGATAVIAFGPLLFVALPVADVVGVMLRRFAANPELPMRQRLRGMFQPDRRHLHYLLVDRLGISRGRATLLILLLASIVTFLGLGMVVVNDPLLALLIGLCGLVFLLLLLLVTQLLAGDR